MTQECGLSCTHCRISSGKTCLSELTTQEGKTVLDKIAVHYQPIIIMTGGDPLLRKDFLELAAHGTSVGLKMVVASCGYGITPEFVAQMKQAGIMAVSLSLDGKDEESHDAFRNQPGSYQAIVNAARVLQEAGMAFQINTTITKKNVDCIDAILAKAKQLGAGAFHPFLFVPTGKGKDIARYSLTADEYEAVLRHVADLSREDPGFRFKPTCAPQYHRIIKQKGFQSRGRPLGDGCMGGKSFAFISAMGDIKICGFLDVSAGNLREHAFDFHDIWQNAELLKDLRNFDNYHGKCGYCTYKAVCGGCRARAYEQQGDYLGDEPFCQFDAHRQDAV